MIKKQAIAAGFARHASGTALPLRCERVWIELEKHAPWIFVRHQVTGDGYYIHEKNLTPVDPES